MTRPIFQGGWGLAGLGFLGTVLAGPGEAPPVDFDRDVRPILRDRCFTCHGPDENQRKAGLRLDRAEGLYADLQAGLWVVAKGDVDRSELWLRVTDPEERMPPDDEGEPLSDAQLEVLRLWIEQGAEWAEHWAFVPPARPAVPRVEDESWPRGEVDRFVLARLEREGLAPSPAAAREALIRRASFDLTGLPPTLEEIDAFVADDSDAAFERVVDRLLASPRYGERMASLWLDLARYADTNGYHIDNHRDMWKWREWVIAAFNRNQPFDRFTIEQLAGDLLPEPTLAQRVATGFNRNGPINFEGGADPDEYQTKYVVDRVVTTSTAWMGLTMACAECHDHKYDPVSTREFYQLYAFFNTIPERGLDGQRSNPVPSIRVPAPEQELRLTELAGRAAQLEARLSAPDPGLDAQQPAWERAALAAQPAWRAVVPEEVLASGGATVEALEDASVVVSGANPDSDVHEWTARPGPGPIWALRVEALADERHFEGRLGRAENGNAVVTEIDVEVGGERVAPAAIVADYSQPDGDFDVTNAIDGDPQSGWALGGHLRPGGRQAVLVFAAPLEVGDGLLRVRLRYESGYARHALGRFRVSVTADADFARGIGPPASGPWHVVGPFTAESGKQAFDTAYPPEEGFDPDETFRDGSTWRPEPEWVDGEGHELAGFNAATYLHRVLESAAPREVALSLGSDDAIRVWLNGELVHSNEVARGLAADQDRIAVRLREGSNELLMKVVNYAGGYGFFFRFAPLDGAWLDPSLVEALARPAAERSPEQVGALRTYYRRNVAARGMELHAAAEEAARAREEFEAQLPETMVMAEMAEPRATHLLERGDFRRKGEPLSPAGPAVLPPIPVGSVDGGRATRLDLARWLVDPAHPLTARVAANRLWQQLFGTGLVKTSEDFGARGERPSHPALLDWLACEYVESGWDTKALLRRLVLSATYRQTARTSPALVERDPENRLLARGPRVRLTAEMIRDQALAVAGLLSPELGGPSVRPYQPPGLWEAVGFGTEYSSQIYEQDHGAALHRRGLYVYWKRAMPYPSLRVFDAPIRETCTTRRPDTNTPLQALVLLNDPTYVEAARGLGERVLLEGGETDDERLAFAFRACTSRRPAERELAVLRRVLAEQRGAWTEFGDVHGFLRVGERGVPESLDPRELAVWAALANMLLNLDATLHKG